MAISSKTVTLLLLSQFVLLAFYPHGATSFRPIPAASRAHRFQRHHVQMIDKPQVNEAERCQRNEAAEQSAAVAAWSRAVPGLLVAGSLMAQVFLSNPSPAHAGFGSGGAAAFSPPLLKVITEKDFLALSQSKQLQRATGVVCQDGDKACERNVDRLLRNLEVSETENKKQIADMKATIQDMVNRVNERAKQNELESARTAEEAQLNELESRVLEATKRSEESLQRTLQLQQQLKDRQAFLDRLAAQPAWVSYFAAALGSVMSTLVMHPVDTLKTRMMASISDDDDDDHDGVGGNASDAVTGGGTGMGKGPASGSESQLVREYFTSRTISEDASAAASAAGAGDAGQFVVTSFGMVSNGTNDGESWTGIADSIRAGSTLVDAKNANLEDVASASATAAIAVVKGDSGDLGDLDQLDILSLYQGLLPNVLKEAPASALYLGVYEVVRQQLVQVSTLAPYPLLVYLLSGAVGEVFGSVVRAPAEAVKTKLQTSDMNLGEALEASLLGEGLRNTFRAWSSSLFRCLRCHLLLLHSFI